MRDVASALRAFGAPELARSLAACGRTATVQSCGGCGELHSATIRATCGLRVCPWCERIAARERGERVTAAALRAPEIVRARAAAVVRELRAEGERARAAVDHWRELERKARARHAATGRARDAQRADGHAVNAEKAETRRARARRWEAAAAHVDRWSWKLVTVSPRWDTRDGRSYSPEGLRARLEDLRARLAQLFEHALSVGGLAAATVRIEASAKGHVHAHVLWYGPHVVPQFLRRIAGCFVDVRMVRPKGDAHTVSEAVKAFGRALREATKYALKAISPLRREWIAGERWRCPHPEYAAAWVLATRDAQLVTHRGTQRDALAAADSCDPAQPPAPPELAPVCRRCGAEVCPVGVVVSVAQLAKVLSLDQWRRVILVRSQL